MTGLVYLIRQVVGPFDGAIIARMLLALVLCGLVGIERSTRERASGFRPHILVGVGACLMTLAGAYGFADVAGTTGAHPDPSRIASYVVSGIGFLGAGAILRHGTTVRGLTTAATLWGAAGIGIACGAGLGGLAALAVLLILFTLSPLRRFEARIRFGEPANALRIHLTDDARAVGKTLSALDRLGVPVKRATMLPGAGTSAILQVELNRSLASLQVPLLIQRLLALKYVERVDTSSLRLDQDELSQENDEDDDGEREDTAILNVHDEALLRDLEERDAGDDRNAHNDRDVQGGRVETGTHGTEATQGGENQPVS